jgi:hypothetical protein
VPALPAGAAAVGLTFEGIANLAEVQSFYNGGTDSVGNPGPDLGVEFNTSALALVDFDAGGSGRFSNAPPPGETVMFFLPPPPGEPVPPDPFPVLNYAAGFDTGFSFYYSSAESAQVEVFSGLDATGSSLGTILLSANWQDGGCYTGDEFNQYCNWDVGSIGFGGTAQSVRFTGTYNLVGFDNVTFGSVVPVPLPAAIWLLVSGLIGFASLRRRS